MYLIDVYKYPRPYNELFDILADREPDENISHERMPEFSEHIHFVNSRPYDYWWLVVDDEEVIGTAYLTRRLETNNWTREIGIFVKREHRGQGWGKAIIHLLLDRYQEPFLAHVNPNNQASKALFQSLGGKLKQITYEIN